MLAGGMVMALSNQDELQERLRLIEAMMAEGKRTTERWGWTFLLWGIGPLLAIAWAAYGPGGDWAWPVTLAVCILVNGVVVRLRKRGGSARTTAGRSIGAVWACTGITVLLLGFGTVASRSIDFRFLYVETFALAAVAHATSAFILRWWPQFLAAMIWWIASFVAFYLPPARLQILAAVSLLLGNVMFGAWLTYRDWRRANG